MQHDPKATSDFLRKWRPDGPWSITSISEQKKILTKTFDASQFDPMLNWVAAENASRNLYFCVNSLLRKMDIKAARTDVKSMDWLQVDIDPRVGEDIAEEQERALRMLQNPPGDIAPPTAIVFSGGGYQGFWRLVKPMTVNGEKQRYEEAASYNKQIEIMFGADHCHSVDHIMRLPGTVNWPNAKKRAKGQKPALAKVVEWHEDRKFRLESFTRAQEVQSADQGFDPNVEISGNIKRFGDVDELDALLPDTGVKLSDRCKVVIVQGQTADHDQKTFPSRSEALFYVCCEMVRAGFDNDTIYSIITDPDFGISESVVEKKSGSDRYAKKQIRSAREHAIDPNLQSMNEKHAVIGDVGGKCRVVSEFTDETTKRPAFSKQSFEDVRNRYCNQKVETGKDKDGRPKYRPLGHWWIDHPSRRYFERMVFAPGKVVRNTYNLWRGFTVEAKPGSCEKYLSHARENLCKGNASLFDYLIKWMARAVQQPDKPGYSAVVLRGDMGTGKSFFVEQFGHLFGSHFLPISDPKFLVGSFNSHLEDCVLLFAEEAFYAGDHKHESVLKNLITGKVLTIEEKGLNLRKSNSCLHLMMASNSDWVVPASLKDRRFFVLDVDDRRLQDHAYFKAIQDELSNGGYEALLHYLMTMDLSDFNVREIPKTEGLLKQQLQSLTTEQEWWFTKLQEGHLLEIDSSWRSEICTRSIDNDYIRHTHRHNLGRRATTTKLQEFLKTVVPNDLNKHQKATPVEVMELNGIIVRINRPYFYSVASLHECRQHWDEKFTKLCEWNTPKIDDEEPAF